MIQNPYSYSMRG